MAEAERVIHGGFPARGAAADRYEHLLRAAEDLIPRLRERADATEAARRLPAETEEDLHERGLFRILQPQRVGGAELDYVALVDFGDMLARGCAATAWNFCNLASHHWLLAMWPKAAQDRIWDANPDVLIGSSFVFPAGKAKKVDGGYRLGGRWPFSSGVDPSAWNMLGGVVLEDDFERHEYRVFILPKSDYEIIDTWHAMGLAGTGSKDVAAEDVFVPEEMTVAVADLKGGPTPGSRTNPNPLYQIPVFAMFPFVLTGVALGNAQATVDDYVTSTRDRVSRYSGAKIGDFQSTQIKIGEASARVDAARRIMRQICEEAMDDAMHGRVPTMLEKTRFRRDGAYAVKLCTEAVDMLYAATGAGGLYLANPAQRRFRDAHAIAAHLAFSSDMADAAYGRVALGLVPDNPTL